MYLNKLKLESLILCRAEKLRVQNALPSVGVEANTAWSLAGLFFVNGGGCPRPCSAVTEQLLYGFISLLWVASWK